MDFNDTPEEAAFRAEARAWLDANAEVRAPDDPPADVLGERSDHGDHPLGIVRFGRADGERHNLATLPPFPLAGKRHRWGRPYEIYGVAPLYSLSLV